MRREPGCPGLPKRVVPYFESAGAAGKELPMVFALPAEAERARIYQEQLGARLQVVKSWPNNFEICGRHCAEAGLPWYLPKSNTWQPEELVFIRRFWPALGRWGCVLTGEVQVALAGICSKTARCDVVSEFFWNMQTHCPRHTAKSAPRCRSGAAYLMDKQGYSRRSGGKSSVAGQSPMLEA